MAGNLRAAKARLEALLKDFPTDVLSLRMLQYLYFYDGDPRPMRDSVAQRHLSDMEPVFASLHDLVPLLMAHGFGTERALARR